MIPHSDGLHRDANSFFVAIGGRMRVRALWAFSARTAGLMAMAAVMHVVNAAGLREVCAPFAHVAHLLPMCRVFYVSVCCVISCVSANPHLSIVSYTLL